VVFGVAACGGSTAQNGKDASTGGDGSVVPTYTVLSSLDAPCDGNAKLTGRAIVDAVKAKYTATYTPIASDAGSTPLTLTFTYASGEARCYPLLKSCDMCGAPDRPAYVEVVFAAHLDTMDGTFNESFDAAMNSSFSFQGTVPVASVKGSFKPAIGGTWDRHDVSFSGQVSSSPLGTQGSASEQAATMGSNGVGMGQVKGVGNWK
jgi:hypothetical protein